MRHWLTRREEETLIGLCSNRIEWNSKEGSLTHLCAKSRRRGKEEWGGGAQIKGIEEAECAPCPSPLLPAAPLALRGPGVGSAPSPSAPAAGLAGP